jgi:mono/diheme cytochrome c family protein
MTFRYSYARTFLLLVGLLATTLLSAQDEAALDQGKSLFTANCAACHAKDMKSNLTGPALGGVRERWEGREELLYEWIRNSQKVIASGDEYAVNLYNEWNKVMMNNFPNLDDVQIDAILAYVDYVYTTGPWPPRISETGTDVAVAPKRDNTALYVGLLVILALLSVVLARIIANLNQIAAVQEGEEPAPKRTLVDILTSKGVVAFVLFALVVFGGYTTVNNAISLNRQQNYAPEQPIKFSHATHSGMQEIDCQYCHDGARRSKHSVIPAANTCMNCHRAIKYGSEYGSAELTKIFASAAYDPNTDTYYNPDTMSMEQLEAMYKTWIGDSYLTQEGLSGLDSEGEELIEDQWAGIVSSLTTDVKETLYGPIPWVRIHNLPDHAYFNHAQHVTVGKLECQTCHGPVEEMELVYQYSPLSMGWCINCHRQTEVEFSDNEYYQAYHNYHEELKSGEREKVTVSDIGGLECQKCHY